MYRCGGQNPLPSVPTLFASQNVIDAIELDMTDQDIEGWTETVNASLDLQYVIPVYATANVTVASQTILDTLTFDHQYMIPVMSDDACIGAVTVVQQENKWVIAVYEHGFDLKAEVDEQKDSAVCFVDVIQLNTCGFLMISADTEEFTIVSGFGISGHISGQEVLNRILEDAEKK